MNRNNCNSCNTFPINSQCLTLVVNGFGDKMICTNGKNCTGVCVPSNTTNNFCLTDVRYINKSPRQFLGNFTLCNGNLSTPPRF